MNPYLDPLLLNAVAEAAAALRAALVAVGAGGADVSARGGPPRVSVVLPADAPSPLGSWTESHEFACRYWRRRVETASGWVEVTISRPVADCLCGSVSGAAKCGLDRGHEGPCWGIRTVVERWDADPEAP